MANTLEETGKLKRKVFGILFALVLALSLSLVPAVPVSAAITISQVTPTDIPVGPVYTELSGLEIQEGAAGDIGLGTIHMDIPAGFELDTAVGPEINTRFIGLTGTWNASSIDIQVLAVNVFGIPDTITILYQKIRDTDNVAGTTGELIWSGTAGVSGSAGTLTSVAGAANKLKITSAPLTLPVWTQGTVTVEVQDQYGNAQPAGAYTVNLASNSTGTYHFYATGTQNVITSINIADGASSGTFDYYDEKVGTPTITVTDAGAGLNPDSQQQTINPAAANELKITSAPLTLTAGTQGTVTVEVQDQYGNPQPAGDYTVNLASDSAGTYHFYTTGTQNIINSIDIADGASSGTFDYYDEKVGTPTITVTDAGAGLNPDSQQQTINLGPANKLKITSAPLNQLAGTQGTVTVEVQDQCGNPQPDGAYTVNLSSNSTGTYHFYTTGTQTVITSIDIGAGASSGTFDYYDEKAGTPTITVTEATLTQDTQQQTINPAAANKLKITSALLTQCAGEQGTVTVEIQDQYGNAQPAGAYTVNLVSYSTGTYHFYETGTQNVITSILIADTVSSGTFDYYDEKAGTPTITVTEATLTQDTQQQTINPDVLARFTITGIPIPASILAGTAFPSPITVTAYDAWGNVKTDYTGTVTWSSSSTVATLPADYQFVGGEVGTHTFPGSEFRLSTIGTQTITVTDGAVSETSSGITVWRPVISGGGVPPPDTTPPTISGISTSNITGTGADINWRTNELGTSQVEYWSSPSLCSPLDETMCCNHLVHLTDLTPGTTYHYKMMSVDSAGNLAVSDEHTFTTPGEAPAAVLSASDLSISPSEVNIGETVTISVLVANTGNAAGDYEVTLKINDVAEATREVTVAAGASEEVTFTTAKDVAGSYSVDVNGLSGSFTVKKPVPTPAPTPPPPPPPPSPPPAPEAINWWLIGGIIAAVIVIGSVTFILVRRRAR